MDSLADVKNIVRSILGDMDADWTTDAYLIPIINHVYKLEVLYLSETCSPYITKYAYLPNMPLGTTDLSQYQNGVDQPFSGLFNPLRIHWKLAGAPDGLYVPAKQFQELPDVSLNPPVPFQPISGMGWEFRQWVVYLTPMQINVDLRIRGEFIPPKLLKESDLVAVHPLLGDVLAEESAACASRERVNPGQMQAYELTGTQALDNIANQLVRSQQANGTRVGRMDGRRSNSNCGAWPGWSGW